MLERKITTIQFPGDDLEQGFFANVVTGFNDLLDYEIAENGKITFQLRKNNDVSSDDSKKPFQLQIEYDENTRQVLAIHDNNFTENIFGKYYSVDMTNLYFYVGKYANENEIDRKRFMDSVCYGVLREIAANNPGNVATFKAGLRLTDYLYKNPPAETYRITKKAPLKPLQVLENSKAHQEAIGIYKRQMAPIPQINLDDFDNDVLIDAMQNYGTFELIGPTIEKLSELAEKVLAKNKEILNLPEIELQKIEGKEFSGYMNILKHSQKVAAEKGGTVLNQIGYFYKPYDRVIPEGVDIQVLDDYYHQGLALLNCLYRRMATTLKIDANNLSNYENDVQSLLSLKRYYKSMDGATGIQPHRDYNILTLVVSDQPGLEVQHAVTGEWIAAPNAPGLRFFGNVGDWFKMQLKEKVFTAGMHRVEAVKRVERHSAIFFFTSPWGEKQETPKGPVVTFKEFLASDKTPYIEEVKPDPVLHPYLQKTGR